MTNKNADPQITTRRAIPTKAHGILLIDKPVGKSSFSLVASLRRLLQVKTIGHAGTLDPLATGVMVLLVGREYTRLSNQLLSHDKAYHATIRLGIATDSYDAEGQVTQQSDLIPTLAAVESALKTFQGEIEQIPPMFSAKKQQGQKLYVLARQGLTVERPAVKVQLAIRLIRYDYPFLEITVDCSKGTYIRSLAHDLGHVLGCGAHLSGLQRTRSGPFSIGMCIDGNALAHLPLVDHLQAHTQWAKTHLSVRPSC
jgi:tRNA pseudouridine55 synthase